MCDYESVAKSLQCCASDSEPCEHCNCELEECNPKTIMEIAADAIKELLAVVPKWISVEERLPDEWREVLTYSPIHSDEKNPHMIQLCWYIGFGKWRECQYGEIMEISMFGTLPPSPPTRCGARCVVENANSGEDRHRVRVLRDVKREKQEFAIDPRMTFVVAARRWR